MTDNTPVKKVDSPRLFLGSQKTVNSYIPKSEASKRKFVRAFTLDSTKMELKTKTKSNKKLLSKFRETGTLSTKKKKRTKRLILNSDEQNLPKIKGTPTIEFSNPSDLSFGESPNQSPQNEDTLPNTNENHSSKHVRSINYRKFMKTQSLEIPKHFKKIKTLDANLFLKKNTFPKKLFSSKFSSSRVGKYISSFAVNSYKGVETSNADKISLILRINKPKNYQGDWDQCSFFAIFTGPNENRCNSFFRDQFHHLLIKNSYFPQSIEKSIEYAFAEAEKHCHEANPSEIDRQFLNCIMCVLLNDTIYVARNCNSANFVSQNRGENYTMISEDKPSLFSPNKRTNLEICKVKLVSSYDFIILGTENLFDTLSIDKCFNNSWRTINKYGKKFQSVHNLSGGIVDHLMINFSRKKPNENATAILIGFNNFDSIFCNSKFVNTPQELKKQRNSLGRLPEIKMKKK